ncbi:histidine ammonia-lyase [Vibrio sp. S9_S30]|uniref:histidine ammonia-lyase n=1 Tax=Vibrio sp. S9_S30 TaxID=2720226 RepID=UPI0016817423|nr:histidine ammonia-lyase [Vibrio sp. S9_S30]MBD1557400.1 histidine ammonia-lyase [Vibrio sp. S9_S30]
MFKPSVFLTLICTWMLSGCQIEPNPLHHEMAQPDVTDTAVQVYSEINHCQAAADIPNCDFEKGIYVLAIDPTVTKEQHQRAVKQAENFVRWANHDVHQSFNNKTIVIGILTTKPTHASHQHPFAIALASATQQIQALEWLYTQSGKDETLQLTTYQKLMQVFDYYVDGNGHTLVGSELNDAYHDFKIKLNIYQQTAAQQNFEALHLNECLYGNGQLNADRALGTPTPCKKEGTIHSGGIVDTLHEKTHSNLNAGVLLGLLYEYKVDSTKNAGGGELIGSQGSPFINKGDIVSGLYPQDGPNMYLTWANPAFKPLNDYLDTYFFANK